MDKSILKVAQLADPQVGFEDYDGELARFQREIDAINASDCQVAVICGDLMHLSTREHLELAKAELSRLRIPWYVVPGNHDVGQGTRDVYEELFGPAFYGVDMPGGAWRLVVMDTEYWQKPQAGKTEEMDALLENELEMAQMKGQKVILAMHSPIFVDMPDEKEEYFNLPLKRREWLLEKLAAGGNVSAVLMGHTHTAFAYVWKGMLFSAGETTSVAFDRVNYGYRRLVFTPDLVRFRAVPVP